MKITKQELETITAELRKSFPVGSTVYTIVRSISRSGMAWTISVLEINNKNVYHPAYKVAAVTGYQLAPRNCSHNAVIVKGCGFDHAGEIVSKLSYALYGNANSLNHEAL